MTMEHGEDLSELAVRLAAFARRTFADFGLGGSDTALAGVGLSPDDFVWRVLGGVRGGQAGPRCLPR